MQKERPTSIQLNPVRTLRIDMLAADMTKSAGVLARRSDVINALVDSIESIEQSVLFQNHNKIIEAKRRKRNRRK
ncbi:hypothetical protein CI266_004636 [Salmonella enterica subsp. enterica serovar Kotte]|nr:hypothetical protein [Salmonella enterica subsp. enterica serovar Kotte]